LILVRDKSHFKRESPESRRRYGRGSEGHQLAFAAYRRCIRFNDGRQHADMFCTNRNLHAAGNWIRCRPDLALRTGAGCRRITQHPTVAHRHRADMTYVRNPHLDMLVASVARFFVDEFRHRNDLRRRCRLHRSVERYRRMIRTLRRIYRTVRKHRAQLCVDIGRPRRRLWPACRTRRNRTGRRIHGNRPRRPGLLRTHVSGSRPRGSKTLRTR
jgi:hypothetical protein